MKTKLFTKEEKDAIDIVLGMGLMIENWYGDVLKQGSVDDVEIVNRYGSSKEYKTLSNGLVQFLKYQE